MTKKIFTAAIAALAVLSSCSKTPDAPEPLTDLYFSEFSLLKEDNEHLANDIVLSNLNMSSSIDVEVPSKTVAEAFDAVTIRYKLSSETAKVLDAEGNELENPFTIKYSKPVEIRLQDGEKFFGYKLSIDYEKVANWELVAATSPLDTLYGAMSVAYDSKNDRYFIAEMYRRSVSTDQIPVLYCFQNNNLSSVLEICKDRSSSAIGVDVVDGKPVVVYGDYTATTAQRLTATTINWDGDKAVTTLGTKGALQKCATTSAPQVFGFKNGNIFVSYQLNEAAGSLAKRSLQVAKYSNGEWSTGITIDGRASSAYGYQVKKATSGDTTYMLVFNQNTKNFSIYKNTGDSWTTVAEGKSIVMADGSAYDADMLLAYDIAINSKGDIFVIAGAKYDGENYRLALQKYDTAKSAFVMLGGVIDAELESKTNPSLAFDKDDNAYATFVATDGSYRPMLSKFDAATSTWSPAEFVCNNHCSRDSFVKISKNGKVNVFAFNSNNDTVEIYAQK